MIRNCIEGLNMDRKEVMRAAVDLLATVVRSVRLRRELAKACPLPHLNF
jgi:hypothetical protein